MAMRIRTFEYFIRETFISLRRNGLMSFASISTVALSLLILGLFLVIVLNLNHMISTVESQVQVSIYLQDDLKEKDIRQLGTEISQMPGVTAVNFVDKNEALQKFKKRLGDQQGLLTALGDTNPLPNAFEIKVDKPERVKAVATAASKLKGVEKARFGQEVIEQLFRITRMLRIGGFVLIIFLALAALFIVVNTIRITVFARRKEIGIMKYVGATDWFIRWPFLLEGMLLGFGGSLIAVFFLSQAYSALTNQIYKTLTFLPLIPKYPFLTNVSIVLMIIGTCIGALGSSISLKRFLKV